MNLPRPGGACGLLLLAVLLGEGTGAAQAQSSETPPDPVQWLGLTPEAAYRQRGAPAEVYPLAVSESVWQAVHFYADHTYLFWTSNRVWQVRLDRLWTGSLSGVRMGMPRTEVEALLGNPTVRSEDWSVWNLPYQAFPRRLRLIFVDGLLADAYLYRSDL